MMEVDANPPAVEEAPPPTSVHEEEDEEQHEHKPAPMAEAEAHDAAAAPPQGGSRRTPRRATEGVKPWMAQDDVEEEVVDPYAGKRPCRLCRVSKVRCDRGAPCSRCMRLGLDCQEQEKQRRGGGQPTRGHLHVRKGSLLAGLLPTGGGGSGGGRRRRANSLSSLPTTGKVHMVQQDEGETGSLDEELGGSVGGGGGGRGRRGPKGPRRQQHGQGKSMDLGAYGGMGPVATANGMLVASASGGSRKGPRSVASGHTTGSESSSISGGGGLGMGGGMDGVGAGYLMCLTVSPTQVLLDTFAKLHGQGRVCQGKTLAVMRGWALAYVRERHEGLASRLNSLGRSLGFDWRLLLSDRDLVQECFLQTRGALAAGARPGQPAAAAPQAPSLASFSPQQLPPFVKDLYTDASAAVALVSVQGATRVLGTPLFARDYMNPDTCNAALARDRADPIDILGSLINREDQPEFFESLSAMLFSNPKPYAEVAHVVKSITRRQTLLTLARARHLIADGGDYWVLVLSFQRLPASVYLNPAALRMPYGAEAQQERGEREENDSTATGTSAEDDDATHSSTASSHQHALHRSAPGGGKHHLHPLLLARAGSYGNFASAIGNGNGGGSGLSSGMESPASANSPTGGDGAAFPFFGGAGATGAARKNSSAGSSSADDGLSRSTSCEDVTTAGGASGRSSAASTGGARFAHSSSAGDLMVACAAIAEEDGDEGEAEKGGSGAWMLDDGGCYLHGQGQPPTQQQQQAAADREVLLTFLDDYL